MSKHKPKKAAGEQQEPPPPPQPAVIPNSGHPPSVKTSPDTTLEPLQLTSDDRNQFQMLKQPEARCCVSKFDKAPDKALVCFQYLSQGGANVIFKIHSWPQKPSQQDQPFLFVDAKLASTKATPIHSLQLVDKVLRINKGLLKTLRCEEVISGFYGHVRPLFAAGGVTTIVGPAYTQLPIKMHDRDYTEYLMEHQGVILYSSVMVNLTSKSDAIGVERGLGSAQQLLTSQRWGILLPDMSPTPGNSVTIELKPKWLAQSPTAPSKAIRCRTCALQVLKPKDPSKYLCPLQLLNGNFDVVNKWVLSRVAEQAAGPTQDTKRNSAISHEITSYLTKGPGKSLLEHLRVLQVSLDHHGILNGNKIGSQKKELHNMFEHNVRLAMTLRDCSLYIRIAYSKDGAVPSSIECKLGDLDFKSADKMDDWAAKETELIESGSYTREIKEDLGCLIPHINAANQAWLQRLTYLH
ncbi:inositol-pentakisphosphate 2-kinase [Parastagonospora nodorum]|nr:inositol-pentakisphosphate 2-kinase [Parastagonospora nodorum]KAH5614698.1 inositol-pentakisphosphate 2-kinase [Parastagonospora nodorum]